MNLHDRNVLMKNILDSCYETLVSKGIDYSGSTANDNFDTIAGYTGVSRYTVWAVYFFKHISAILRFCKDGKLDSEGIKGRIIDAIGYLAILHTLIVEDEDK